MIEKRSKLGESQNLQQFSRDADDIEAWISEKLQTAMDESYKDPTNIQVRFILTTNVELAVQEHFCITTVVRKTSLCFCYLQLYSFPCV